MQNHLCVHAMQLCQLGCNVFAVLLAGKCFQRCALARFWSTLAMLKIWAATNFCYKWAYTQTFAVACTTSIAAPLMLHFMKFKHFEHTHTHTHTHTQDKICTATRTHHLYEQKSQSAAGRLRPQRGQRFDLHDTGFETHEIGVGAQRVGQVDTHIYTYRVCFHISRAGCTPRSNHDLIYILETLRLKTS
jgi:hypothetical protein